MYRPGTVSSELGFLSPVYPISGFGPTTEQRVNRGGPDAMHLAGESVQNAGWERRRLRKHRRRTDNEGCSPKRRRLMGEVGCGPWDDPGPGPGPEISLSYPGAPPPQPCPKAEGSCMEVEAAQRRLQEIEERITLEDDDDEEDLDVEPAQSRPVLVMSESLRKGLQRGFDDILPQTVAKSVSRSCMELVVWRPPEEALPPRLKDSLQRQRKQAACRQPPAPASPQPSPAPEREARAGLYCTSLAQPSTEEEMEL
ncbi:hypothetical protein AAFF_G00178150 [Aldrovandia affinis]|uniref:Coiled-coil domain-containing protein 117 n=1 Tax=Aldrovandia affinis TaxID=143900 RepID=A0AAD7W7S6_9TELE|nr:hypothetical protein AAFF_G00178150 [Aldrovandia affinis]